NQLRARYYSGIATGATSGILDPNSSNWMGKANPTFTGILNRAIAFTTLQGTGFPDSSGTLPAVPPIAAGNNQGALWTGFINIPQSTPITFATGSDDGSRIWIDGSGPDNVTGATLLVNNFFDQGTAYRNSGPQTFSPGLHSIAIAF